MGAGMEHSAAHAMILRFLAPVCLVFASACGQAEAMTSDQLESRLNADLSLGMAADEVAKYLNENELSSDGAVTTDQLRPVGDRPGHSDFLAILRNVRKGGLVSTALQMRFVFDEQEELTEISVREIHTGP